MLKSPISLEILARDTGGKEGGYEREAERGVSERDADEVEAEVTRGPRIYMGRDVGVRQAVRSRNRLLHWWCGCRMETCAKQGKGDTPEGLGGAAQKLDGW